MAKSLVIVESPAKAKTINKYLGKDYVVKSSVGHIRDLPTAGSSKGISDPKERARQAAITRKLSPSKKAAHKKKKARMQLIKRMGIDPEKDWAASYEILPGKEKVVNELKRLAANSETIYLATDLDREGEAIAWHLKEAIGGDESRYQRVVFNEITKKAIEEAFDSPGVIDNSRVDAQQARRFLDRIVGYMVSPLLWAKVARGLSAGRVQSVATRLIVDREREIRAFIPEEYWELYIDLTDAQGKDTTFYVHKYVNTKFRPNSEEQTNLALNFLKEAHYKVSDRQDKPTQSKPSAPFITSTLQQASSTRLGFSVKKTMMLAQRLYEAGYITYMRTDSTNLSSEAVNLARGYILENFDKNYLPAQANSYSSKKGAQEAHEAIRPTSVDVQQYNLKGMERDAERLYELIWRQFVACQMTPAQYILTVIIVQAGDYELNVKGRIVRFEGYTKVQAQAARKDVDQILPDIKNGDTLTLKKLDPTQHFTKPTPRYGEASLVKEMEKRGIGRPSTYAAIISTIQDRGYVRLENKRLYAEKMGDIVTERLTESFNDLLDYGFTASMEGHLDEIADGNSNWKDVLNNFYEGFKQKLSLAEAEETGMRPNEPTMTDISCPTCERFMQIRTASTGVFLGCSGYSLPPKERCKKTINLSSGDEAMHADNDEEAESRLLRSKHRCNLCNAAMDSYLIDESRKLHVCGNNPDCDSFEIEEGVYVIKGYEGPVLECDKCSKEMQLKTGRFGKYFGCTSETCKNTRKLLRNGEAAPPKMDPVPIPDLQCAKVEDHYILRDGAAGLFLAASKFPKNRETRAPFVDEIMPYKDQIDHKYAFIFTGPTVDDDGNRTQIRYSRKTKEQYLMTEVEGKASGWRAYYDNGSWREEKGRKKPPT